MKTQSLDLRPQRAQPKPRRARRRGHLDALRRALEENHAAAAAPMMLPEALLALWAEGG
ncbi:hypothetical protein KKF91_14040 [Myxococcota bacterium]|nr:hypothetical protein [Myxococcota bacterium]MBU1431660.1 hypothetical protein [Myxococcota bacterium]MBU1898688.1 hypothetical protein [Myxococcota bacterium]